MKKSIITGMSLMLITGVLEAREPVPADTRAPNPTTSEGTMRDHSDVNKHRDERALTPLDQSLSKSDQDITQAVRKSIMKQDLSMGAKNVTVITQNGEVTLSGSVETRAEAEKIVNLAQAVAGVKRVNNNLKVK